MVDVANQQADANFLSQKAKTAWRVACRAFLKGMARTAMPTREVARIKEVKFVEVQEFLFCAGPRARPAG
jgi:hypothetical protein